MTTLTKEKSSVNYKGKSFFCCWKMLFWLVCMVSRASRASRVVLRRVCSAWTTHEHEVSTWWAADAWGCSRPGSLLVATTLQLRTGLRDLGMATQIKTDIWRSMVPEFSWEGKVDYLWCIGFRKTRSGCLFTAQEWTATKLIREETIKEPA